MEAVLGYNVDLPPQQPLDGVAKIHERKASVAGNVLDKQINVTFQVCFGTGKLNRRRGCCGFRSGRLTGESLPREPLSVSIAVPWRSFILPPGETLRVRTQCEWVGTRVLSSVRSRQRRGLGQIGGPRLLRDRLRQTEIQDRGRSAELRPETLLGISTPLYWMQRPSMRQ